MLSLRSGVILATAGALIASTAAAAGASTGGFNVTIADQPANSVLAALPSSVNLNVSVSGLPESVGMYALHCAVPDNPRSAPTQCDSAEQTLAYLPAGTVPAGVRTFPMKINAEFYGVNPSPQVAASTKELVDCRADTGNPRTTSCAVYILGAGREASNPAYLRVFPTQFTALTKERRNDTHLVTVNGERVTQRNTPKLTLGNEVSFSATLGSGLTPTISSDNCSIQDSSITALANEGTCTVTVMSSGGKNVKPLLRTITFSLMGGRGAN
ncbi:MAG: hypothetical protein O2943_05850 [Actinomycetota bacterium]|nr:hypothetical protein [Actinomycetota bacterium]